MYLAHSFQRVHSTVYWLQGKDIMVKGHGKERCLTHGTQKAEGEGSAGDKITFFQVMPPETHFVKLDPIS